jgi:glycosyltransferase involved in cell wall biosynthesis
MEAMACGTPVVATNWSGPAAFVTEQNGYPLRIEKQLVDAP